MRSFIGVALLSGVFLALHGSAEAQKTKPREVVVGGKTIADHAKALASKELVERVNAANMLGSAGPEARAAVPALIGVFRDPEAGFLKPIAVGVLARVGADAVPLLEKALDDKSPEVRGNAALALGGIGFAARSTVPKLVELLADKDDDVRRRVATGLGRMGGAARSSARGLTALLKDANTAVRVEAAAALYSAAGSAAGVEALAAALKDADSAARALEALTDIGQAAKKAGEAVEGMLTTKDRTTQLAAAVALAKVTGDGKSSVAALTKILAAEKDAGERAVVIDVLGLLGASADATSALVKELSSADAGTRRAAASALCDRSHKRESAAAALESALADADAGVRFWSALALALGDGGKRDEDVSRLLRLGGYYPTPNDAAAVFGVRRPERATVALAAMIAEKKRPNEAARLLGILAKYYAPPVESVTGLLGDADLDVREAASAAVAANGPEVIGPMTRLLTNADARLRESGARTLGNVGLAAKSTAPALARLLKDADAGVRVQAASALWAVDQQAEAALLMLSLTLKDVDIRERHEAVEAVGRISVEARPAIRGLSEVLVNAVKDRDARVRTAAAKWLWRRSKQAKTVVPLLRDGLTDRDVYVRRQTAEILGEMGNEDRAVPMLLSALDDKDAGVRLTAMEGLARSKAAEAVAEGLASKDKRTRLGAIRALELMGKDAKAAVPALKKAAGDADAEIKTAAAEALRAAG